ncbi:MAG TPA: DUF1161 domain-containing protein [Burkholderiales bacterium]|nr:DUF1161 domain-containing protein [Burkholderiales bacterium]
MAIAASLLIASPVLAQVKPCEELKGEIDTKIKNNGVPAFTTTIVDKDAAEDGKVVGTCDGGTKKIVYKRGEAEPAPAASSAPAASPAPAAAPAPAAEKSPR